MVEEKRGGARARWFARGETPCSDLTLKPLCLMTTVMLSPQWPHCQRQPLQVLPHAVLYRRSQSCASSASCELLLPRGVLQGLPLAQRRWLLREAVRVPLLPQLLCATEVLVDLGEVMARFATAAVVVGEEQLRATVRLRATVLRLAAEQQVAPHQRLQNHHTHRGVRSCPRRASAVCRGCGPATPMPGLM